MESFALCTYNIRKHAISVFYKWRTSEPTFDRIGALFVVQHAAALIVIEIGPRAVVARAWQLARRWCIGIPAHIRRHFGSRNDFVSLQDICHWVDIRRYLVIGWGAAHIQRYLPVGEHSDAHTCRNDFVACKITKVAQS